MRSNRIEGKKLNVTLKKMPHIRNFSRKARKAIKKANKRRKAAEAKVALERVKTNSLTQSLSREKESVEGLLKQQAKVVLEKASLKSSLDSTNAQKVAAEAKFNDLGAYLERIDIIVPEDPNDPDDPNIPDDPDRPKPTRRECIDFEDLVPTKEYPHGTSFVSEGWKFDVIPESHPKVKLPADPITSGKAVVVPSPGPGTRNCPQDFGQAMHHNNCLVRLDIHQMPKYAQGVQSACFNYCDMGGHVYLRVNGRSWNFSTMVEDAPGTAARELRNYHGKTLGGVKVFVTKMLYGMTSSSGTVTNDHWGIVYLIADSDLVHEIEVGGQEFQTDRWCIPCRETPRDDQPNDPPITYDPKRCIEFEDLVAGRVYPHSAGASSKFKSQGITFEVIAELDPLVQLPASMSFGEAIVEPSPGVGLHNCPHDFGQSIMHNNCIVKLDVTQFPDHAPLPWVPTGAETACFNYCDLGGHVYLRVNGVSWDFHSLGPASPGMAAPEMLAYHNLILDGVRVQVTKFGAYTASGARGRTLWCCVPNNGN